MPSAKTDLRKVIVQFELSKELPTIPSAQKLLGPSGFELDESYGPICVNPVQKRYVVRGAASDQAIAELRKLPGVAVFPDAKVEPIHKKGS